MRVQRLYVDEFSKINAPHDIADCYAALLVKHARYRLARRRLIGRRQHRQPIEKGLPIAFGDALERRGQEDLSSKRLKHAGARSIEVFGTAVISLGGTSAYGAKPPLFGGERKLFEVPIIVPVGHVIEGCGFKMLIDNEV